MSFTLKLKAGKGQFEWHINGLAKKPFIREFDEIEYFQADSDELGYIMLRLRNVPITHGGTCKWRGELAQFIYDNL